MAIPGRVKNAGNNTIARNVFRVTFSAATYHPPMLKAWDVFCPLGTCTTNKEIFVGTALNGNKPMLSAVATTDGAPASNWKPAAATPGGAVINRLRGSISYVVLSVADNPGTVTFNLCWEIPADAGPEVGVECTLAIEYAHWFTFPVLTWYFNDVAAGGTEAVPVWTQITPESGGHIIRPCDAGVSSPNLEFTIPPSGLQDNPELWISTI